MGGTVQEVFRAHFRTYAKGRKLARHHWHAARALSHCRTAMLGGHVQRCPQGHVNGVWFNSCRHRWCPQCNGLAKERWLQRQRERMLDCAHRHLVFTIPSELRLLFRLNERALSQALFDAAHETLRLLTRDERYLGARCAMMLVRHTWGRNLSYHPHIHALVSEGGLDAQGQWRAPRRRCFLPARVVMALFRGKYLGAIGRAFADGLVLLPRGMTAAGLRRELNRLGRLAWNVRVGERYGHGGGVATYLARYVRGGPLSNAQLRRVTATQVVMRYTAQRKDTGKRTQTMSLSAQAFLQRYLMHVPPRGHHLVRHYGLYASGCREALDAAREWLHQSPVCEFVPMDWRRYLERFQNTRAGRCRVCAQALRHAEELEPVARPP